MQGVVSNFTKLVYYFEVYDQNITKFASVKHFFSQFYRENDSIRNLTLHSKQPIFYNKKDYPRFAILISNVNTRLKNKVLF